MWIWAELQLAPTHDTLAIKRAYAKRLKTTRPDDDATAYQRLREAYEHALAWAAHASRDDSAADAPDDAAARVTATSPDPAPAKPPADVQLGASETPWLQDDGLPTAATDDGFGDTRTAAQQAERRAIDDVDGGRPPASAESTQADVLGDVPGDGPGDALDGSSRHETDTTPEDVARGVHAAWQQHGDDTLLAVWPQVRADLDRIPLARRAEASNWMASLVLESPALPPAFVRLLADHFQWGADFRVTQSLGGERAFLLFERLRDLGILRSNDPALQRRHADLLRLQALLAAGRRKTASLLALLLRERNFEGWASLRSEQRNRIGIDGAHAAGIEHRLQYAFGIRGVLYGLVLAALTGLLPAAHAGEAAVLALLAGSLGMVAILALWFMALVLQRRVDGLMRALATRVPLFAGEPSAARLTGSVALALVAALVATLEVPGAAFVLAPAALLLCACALVLAWSEANAARLMLIPVSVALAFALRPLLPGVPVASVGAIAFAWTLLAHWLMLRLRERVMQFYRSPLTYFRPRHVWGWLLWVVFIQGVLAMAAAVTLLVLPLTLMVQSIGYGQRCAIATLGIGLYAGYVLARDIGQSPLILLCLLGSAIAMSLVQAGANLLARSRVFRRASRQH